MHSTLFTIYTAAIEKTSTIKQKQQTAHVHMTKVSNVTDYNVTP